MSRLASYVSGGVLTTLLAAGVYYSQSDGTSVTDLTNSLQEFTSEQLWQQEVEQKIAKRKAGYAKMDKPSEYTKFHQGIRTKWGQDAPAYPTGYQLTELQKATQRSASANARQAMLAWKERGPGNVPGRTRAVLVLPADPTKNTWLIGSVAGGIWKTTNAGESWTWLTPNLPNMATTTLAMSAADDQIIYAGTGESFAGYNATNGNGIYRSEDGGESWNQLSSTNKNERFVNINRIIVSDEDPNTLLAVTSPGYWQGAARSYIMRSTDGGASWQQVYSSTSDIQDIDAVADNFMVQYASVEGQGVLKSTDGGLNWVNKSQGIEAGGRIELAIAPSDPNTLYIASVGEHSGAGSDLYISNDGAESWNLVLDLQNNQSYDFLGGQGWYDNTLAVNPYRADEVYVAGVNMFRVRTGTGAQAVEAVTGVDQENTQSFLGFVNFGAEYFDGRLSVGSASTLSSVEVRFGSGKSQMAHRFTVPAGATSGVPAANYTYQDYIEVPFEVWDTKNNRQLMVSFRDQEADGVFNLSSSGNSDINREYLYIHNLAYDASAPATNVAKAAGHEYEEMYFFWPTLAAGSSWNPNALPAATLRINYGTRIVNGGSVAVVCDAYGRLGGPNNFSQSTNQTTVTGVHPDHHNIVMVPADEAAKTFRIIGANDGGIYVAKAETEPGLSDGDWRFAGQGYNTTQFYGIDKKPGEDVYIGGTQDNGTWRSPNGELASASTSYLRALGGDGFEVVWNYEDPDKMMGTIYYNNILRTTNGGQSWTYGNTGLEDQGTGSVAPFITKLANSKSRPNTVFAVGKQGVWKTDDFGVSWSLSPINSSWTINSFTDVEVSVANPDIIWAGAGMTLNGALKLHVSTNGGASFSPVATYTGEEMGVLTGIFTHPTEENTAYAVFSYAESPKILKTTDLGQSWTDISGFQGQSASASGFPDVAVYSLLVMPHNPLQIWVGTEIGLVESTDGGASWHMANNGFPNVAIWDMKVVDQQVVVGTHARGIWSVTIDEINSVVYPPQILSGRYLPNGEVKLDINLRYSYDSYKIMVGNQVIETVTNAKNSQVSYQFDGQNSEGLPLKIVAYEDNLAYVSNELILNSPYQPIASVYQNVFTEPSADFVGNGFFQKIVGGFNSAIHSVHYYRANVDYTYNLNVPIRIASQNAVFEYDEVAAVQPGDFVVVEGSLDGTNWLALAEPYNANGNADWMSLVENDIAPDRTNLQHKAYNLLDVFEAGDVVAFRFRLSSNSSNQAYGWVIDNLNIQGADPLGYYDEVAINALALGSYPNPSPSGKLTVQYNLPKPSAISLKVYTVEGRVLKQVELKQQAQGEHTYPINLANQPSGVYLIELTTEYGSRQLRVLR